MGDAHRALQDIHVTLPEYIPYQAIVFPEVQAVAIAGDHACCILASVLKYGQCIVQLMVYVAVANHSYYAAHCSTLAQIVACLYQLLTLFPEQRTQPFDNVDKLWYQS